MNAYSLEYDLPFAAEVLDLLTTPGDRAVRDGGSDIHPIGTRYRAAERMQHRREFLAALRAAEAAAEA